MTMKELTPTAEETATQGIPPPPMQAPSAPRPKRRKLAISQLTTEQMDQLVAPDLNCVEPCDKSDNVTLIQGKRTLPKGFTYIARSA